MCAIAFLSNFTYVEHRLNVVINLLSVLQSIITRKLTENFTKVVCFFALTKNDMRDYVHVHCEFVENFQQIMEVIAETGKKHRLKNQGGC